jgi:D-sedoheptulose 7-phosphate isomerase
MQSVAKQLLKAFDKGNKVLICGNGGSSAESAHFAGELVCKLTRERRPLPAIDLSSNTSVITAIANDYGYENVFSRQVEALGQDGDVLITLTTSGKSPNVLKAEKVAKSKGLEVIRLVGVGTDTMSIQESHLKNIHQICFLIEEVLCQS